MNLVFDYRICIREKKVPIEKNRDNCGIPLML